MLRETVVDRIADGASQSVDSTQAREGQETATGTVIASISGDRDAAADEEIRSSDVATPAARRSRGNPGAPPARPPRGLARHHRPGKPTGDGNRRSPGGSLNCCFEPLLGALAWSSCLELLLGALAWSTAMPIGQRANVAWATPEGEYLCTRARVSAAQGQGCRGPPAGCEQGVVGFRWGDGQDGQTSLDQQSELP
jgi:hypothetical protein